MAPAFSMIDTMQAWMPSTAVLSSVPPKKYVKVHGVIRLNPAYKKWRETHDSRDGEPVTTMRHPSQALPVVTNMEDHAALCEASLWSGGKDIPLAEATVVTIDYLQEPHIAEATGMQGDEVIDELGKILNKYEAPIGLMTKLMILTEFQYLEFMVDDSGSMNSTSDTFDSMRRPQTRWREAQSRLKAMLEILAYVPFPEIHVCFLNRPIRLILTRYGRSPAAFLADAYHQIDAAFQHHPAGTTPVLERLHDSLLRGRGQPVARYLFCDGQPDGGNSAKAAIVRMLITRPDPQGNPITFLSCTGDDEDVEWMKDAEEIISYCAEYDDFNDESNEVAKDQGKALPFTIGFYLICSLVAAMNPDDLDAMDESVPYTKATLDNLLGIQHDEKSYRHYFDSFLEAQRKRPISRDDYGHPKKIDQIKRNYNWRSLYEEFLKASVAKQIPAVQQFKQQLALLEKAQLAR